jgi:hypothetical protein
MRFYSPEGLDEFIARERNFYGWLNERGVSSDVAFNHIRNIVAQIHHEATQGVEHWRSGQWNPENVKTNFLGAFAPYRVPTAASPAGKFIEQIREDYGDKVAAGALTALMNETGRTPDQAFRHPDMLRGVIAAYGYEAGITPKAPVAARRALSSLIEKHNTTLADLDSQGQAQADAFARAEARNRKFVRVVQGLVRHRLRRYQARKNEEIAAAIESFEKTEQLYRAQMKLKAPVEYWNTKAAKHRDNAAKYRAVILAFAVLASFAIGGGLYKLGNHLAELAAANRPAAVLFVFASMGAVGATIIFWFARVLVRLFLREHHLAIDAEERATMALTYLALTADEKADEKERALVLASLFRPTADGIVKDDAAPDLAPGAILSKILAK